MGRARKVTGHRATGRRVTAHHDHKATALSTLIADLAHRVTDPPGGRHVPVAVLVVHAVAVAVVVVDSMALLVVVSAAQYPAVVVAIRGAVETPLTAKAQFAHLISSKAMVPDAGEGAKTTRIRR